MFKKIALVTHDSVQNVGKTLTFLIDYLTAKDKTLIINTGGAKSLKKHDIEVVADTEIGSKCDLGIAIGGDGIMLMAARLLCRAQKPLLGINLGRVGFLADISVDNIQPALDQILAGHYLKDERFLINVEVHRDRQVFFAASVLNDVAIQKWQIARMIKLNTYINGVFVHTHLSDGIIVSTPTGSTAYALSGGGPILQSSLEALSLVPVCPHTLSNRPIVINSKSQIDITIETEAAEQACLTCDGEIKTALMPQDKVHIYKGDSCIHLLHLTDYNQFKTLREKLHWSK